MNGAHFHLVVNHFPIILPVIGILVMLAGLLFKSEPVQKTAFFLFVSGSVATFAAMASGEGAEEVVEKMAEISKDFIHRHEEAAETFAILNYILGVVSLAGLWAGFTKKSFFKAIAIAAVCLAAITMYFAQKTGTTGGEIRHTEIRSVSAGNAPVKNNESENEDND
jgi:uncharacterized membrane protein